MKRNKRSHNPEFKADIAMAALRGKYSVKEIASHFDVNPSLVHAWRQRLADAATELFAHGKRGEDPSEPSDRALDRRLGELQAEQEWMRRALSSMPLREKRSCVETGNREISILGQSRLLGLHRSGVYYKSSRGGGPDGADDPAETETENAEPGSGAANADEL